MSPQIVFFETSEVVHGLDFASLQVVHAHGSPASFDVNFKTHTSKSKLSEIETKLRYDFNNREWSMFKWDHQRSGKRRVEVPPIPAQLQRGLTKAVSSVARKLVYEDAETEGSNSAQFRVESGKTVSQAFIDAINAVRSMRA